MERRPAKFTHMQRPTANISSTPYLIHSYCNFAISADCAGASLWLKNPAQFDGHLHLAAGRVLLTTILAPLILGACCGVGKFLFRGLSYPRCNRTFRVSPCFFWYRCLYAIAGKPCERATRDRRSRLARKRFAWNFWTQTTSASPATSLPEVTLEVTALSFAHL